VNDYKEKHTLGDLLAALMATMIICLLVVAFYKILPPAGPPRKPAKQALKPTPRQLLAARVRKATRWSARADRGMHVRLERSGVEGHRLVLTVAVTNTDSRSHLLPRFRLADDRGNTHGRDTSYHSRQELRILEQINPDTGKEGEVAFIVPIDGRKYALIVPGSADLLPVHYWEEGK